MTDPKHTVHTDFGRNYIHPVTGAELIGVSTLMKWAIAKPFLKEWGERQVAEAAMAWFTDPGTPEVEPSALARYFREAPNLFTSSRAHTGDVVHDWAVRFKQNSNVALPAQEDLHQFPLADLPRARQMCEHYRDLAERWHITFHLNERTVFNSELGIAGTFDDIISSPLLFDGQWHMADTKTTSGAKPRADITYQLPCYAAADGMWDDAGIVSAKPEVSLERGYVLKVKETGGALHKVEYRSARYQIDMFEEIRAAVAHYRWAQFGDRLVSVPLANPEAAKPRDVERRIAAAGDYDSLIAVYRWATVEGVWNPDTHQELAATRRRELENH